MKTLKILHVYRRNFFEHETAKHDQQNNKIISVKGSQSQQNCFALIQFYFVNLFFLQL